MPQPHDDLPIDNVLPELLASLAATPFAVLVAPPGAGKTTRLPLALLEAGWRGDGRVIVLEPRRLAARAAARRMAQSLGEAVGETVGYRVRLESRVSARTRIEVVTEGVFTRMLLNNAALDGVAAVLFDEFHERSLDGDLGLALALDATALRPELRLLVMSATLDALPVARLLNDAPVIVSDGRTFPVETRYLPAPAGGRLEAHIAACVRRALADLDGSILVFLPGEAEIRRTAEVLGNTLPPGAAVLPLYGQLGAAEQDRAIAPAPTGSRKVVLASAIAQTSLTIEGVRIVIDSGLSRVPAYDPATGLTALVTRRVSRAAADQRRGRAGRTAPGICYRLWSAPEDAALLPFDPPQITQADLAGLALDLAAWGVADPGQLAFLDPPPAAAWSEAVTLLRQLDAIDASGHITGEGRALAALPLHPRLAHMVHQARLEGEGETAAELAVLLGERGLGGNSLDLAERLDRFRGDTSRRAIDARRLVARWVGQGPGESAAVNVGWHLARAYPDRVAQAAGARGRFRLANGRAASLEPTEPLFDEPFIVVAELSGSAGNGRIRRAAAIDQQDIERLFGHRIAAEESLSFDRGTGRVRARKIRRLGALRLAEQVIEPTNLALAAEVLAAGVAELGLEKLPWTAAQKALRARATYLAATVGEPWPDLSDAALSADLGGWLGPITVGKLAVSEITAEDLEAALAELLPWPLRREMEVLLPTHYEVPTGSRLPIDYEAENGPALSVRVQEVFGLDLHPTIAGGRVPLLLVLLSPAHRPIQTTRDLPGFWRGSWRDVARELKGRYPRHPWPDDPLAAAATNRAKPRRT